ncbi:aminopeptidase N [Actinomyces sp. oral taxon 897]|uniref:aminopeptidase N n=1 Tax=Actinomyces sp. oral taxon 897 TaxID=2081702 RepID=UPI000D03C1E5|nr:aminopeptidase N [Actinomyces sp. oral taxon 897]AVM61212.1 aminopeptidase N [Actinomyces sp. oral taxon 897]
MTLSVPPARLTSPTNLSRQEARWRSDVVHVTALDVHVDVTGAVDAGTTGFPVSSTLHLVARQDVEGLWADFLGESVDRVVLDGAAVPVAWDGARVGLPALAAGEHEVVIQAVGRYSNSGQGLHRLTDPVDGATYLYTHFEPSDARRAWPCLDQPDLRARLRLTVTHPAGWTVLGNGTVATTRQVGAAVVSGLSTTEPLPTYLTALAAGPWHRVTGTWVPAAPTAPVPLSWSCRSSLAAHLDADELLDLTGRGLSLYERTYTYPYPWGSYDCVLVPEYNIGAMENPGCVTFSEDAYLFRGPATRAQHAGRANTLLHEMCHMWFGDLVTPRWWEDTWLKESFADYTGTWAEEQLGYAEAWVAFASSRKLWAYQEDTRPDTTHPVVATVHDVEAARQAFDGITYAKGASVLKQLVAYVGQERFLAAANTWFAEHAFGNGELSEFLETLTHASGRDMSAWAHAWLRTSGPSYLSSTTQVHDARVARLTVRQEGVDLSTGRDVLRPHTLVVGLYSLDPSGALVRTHRLPVTLTGREAEVAGAVGLDVPDLVLVNDEDLTYAVVRPDARSLATARTHLADLADPLARSLLWSMLHNLVRDGLLEAEAFVDTVLRQADDTTEAATLATLLSQALQAATRYAGGGSAALVARLVGDDQGGAPARGCWGLLRASAPGSDAQLVRARAWLSAAGQAGLAGEGTAVAGRVRRLLDGALSGLELTADLRWRALTALARLDAVTDEELSAQLEADPGALGVTRHLQASSSRPRREVKEAVLARLLEDRTLGNDHVDALVAAFGVDAHRGLTAPLTTRYLAALEGIWSTRSQEIATRLVTGLFPAAGDADDLRAVRRWLADHEQAPPALRRLVLKSYDDLDRAVRVRDAASRRSADA